jgi:hypothetical protein
MSWVWRYEDADGEAIEPVDAPPSTLFPSQGDAESWLGENWRELHEAGVEQVSLLEDDRLVYEAMSLKMPEE